MPKVRIFKRTSQRKSILSFKKSSGIFSSIDETIGKTPMVQLKRLKSHLKFHGNIIAKLESFNPLGSVKDRIGLAMINSAEKKKTYKFFYNNN